MAIKKKPVKKWRKLVDNFQKVSEDKEFGIIKWKIKEKSKFIARRATKINA